MQLIKQQLKKNQALSSQLVYRTVKLFNATMAVK